MNTLTPDAVLQSRYKIISQLGRGGMGAVYLANDARFGNMVAIKQTLMQGDELGRAFEREARLLNKLRHAALPVVSDYFTEGDGQFLVMQYIAGDDLSGLMQKAQRPFETDAVLRWTDQLLDALEYLHTQEPPVIHRDIKPQNLKLTPRGEIVLLDFGLSKAAFAPAPGGTLAPLTPSRTATSLSVVGYTPHYAPFEQITGGGTDARSDLFSLAATVYHLLTFQLPPNAMERAEATMNGRPDPLRPAHELNQAVPPQVSEVLRAALAMNREARPASAAEMRSMLRAAWQPEMRADSLPTSFAAMPTVIVSPTGAGVNALTAPELSAATRPLEKKSWRRLPLVGAAGALSFALCLVAVWNWSSWRRAPAKPNDNAAVAASDAKKNVPRFASRHAPSEASFKFDTVELNADGSLRERRTRQGRYFSEDLGEGVSIEMIAIPGGEFLMGASDAEAREYKDEQPQHKVKVPAFYMGKYEVTQAQWRAVARLPKVNRDLNPDPSEFKGDNLPVENVSWDDAVEFCARLSAKAGRDYRLPSESEWEYAARAGSQTPFSFGDTITTQIANFDGEVPYGKAAPGEFRKKTLPVGSLGVANKFGLYDMNGNVWEWTAGEYHDSYVGAPTDGKAWETSGDNVQRVRRGGAWDSLPVDCRSANRYSYAHDGKRNTLGFRVAMSSVQN